MNGVSSEDEMPHFLPGIFVTLYCEEKGLKLLFGRRQGNAYTSIDLLSLNMDRSSPDNSYDRMISLTSGSPQHMHTRE